jgi:hypothetical protein
LPRPSSRPLVLISLALTGTAATAALSTAATAPAAAARATRTVSAIPVAVARSVSTPPSVIAARDAASLIPRLHLPAGAVAVSGPPAGAGPALAAPPIVPATPNLATSVAYWTVPEAPAAVIAYVSADPPAGARKYVSGDGGQNGLITSSFEGFAFSATKVLGQRSLGLTVVPTSPTTSAVLVEAADVWLTPRPASETVPASARLVIVSILPATIHTGGRRPSPRRIFVTDGATVKRLTAAVNALPASQPGVTACPAGDGSRLTLAFRATAHAADLAFVDAGSDACGAVALTLHGRAQPGLGGGFTLPAAVARILGIR